MVLRKLGKILGICSAGLLLLALLLMLGVKLALDRVPAYQEEIKAWVHQQTGYHIRFAHVSPALRWYGPELSFQRLELRSKDDRRVLARAARGRIGSDIWRLLSSGKLFAGRVELDSPDIVVARLGKAQFALASEIPLRHADAAATALNLDDLPTGRLVIRDGRITVAHWNPALPNLVLGNVDLDITRDAGDVAVNLDARLPPALGGKLSVAAKAHGLGDLDSIEWSADVRTRDISFTGWRQLLPEYLHHLDSGSGAFGFGANGRGRDLARAVFDFAAKNVVTRMSDGTKAQFDQISGSLALTHEGDRWTLLGRGVRASRHGRNDPASQFDVTWRGDRAGLLELRAHASYLRADNLLPLAGLMPRKAARDRLIAISPTGEWTNASLLLSRREPTDPWQFQVRAQFRRAGFAPIGRSAGLRGLSGSLAGDQDGGHVTLDARAATIAWPYEWQRPVDIDALDGTIYWRRTPQDLLIATPGLAVENHDAKLRALAALRLPANGDSPILTMVSHVADGNAAAARYYLPRARLHPKSLAWLDQAFVSGRVSNGVVVYNGPVRHFPFRDGSGLFLARFDVDGMTLHYGAGWPPLEDVGGSAEFRNQGLVVHLRRAKAGGISVDSGEARFADLKNAELNVDAKAAFDASAALRFLRASPLDAKAGRAFSAVSGRGPMSARIKLFFPFKDFAHRRVLIQGAFDGVTLDRPGSALVASGLKGDFTVDGAQLARADIRGRMLGGPFRADAHGSLKKPATRTVVNFRGTLDGDALGAALGLPAADAIRGQAQWHAVLKMIPAPALERSLRVSSNLEGLTLDLPQPLGKPKERAIPAWAEIQWPAADGPVINAALGSIVHATVALRPDSGGERIAHAAIMFGDAEPVFSDSQVFNVRGLIQRLDLAGWRKLYTPEQGGGALTKYLRTAKLDIREADFGGFAVRDFKLGFVADDDRWLMKIDGPNVAGTIDMPAAGAVDAPWNLSFERLSIDEAAAADGGGAKDGGAGPAESALRITPERVPAVDFRAKRLTWGGRDFGDVSAKLSKVDDGVNLDQLTIAGKSFNVQAHGDWRGPDPGRGRLAASLVSTDVQATLAQLGYARVIAAKKGRLDLDLRWAGAPTADAMRDATGHVRVALDHGQVFGIKPGAGRVLGLASIAALPRRLALDFSDLTDKGLAFDTVSGDFDLRGGNAYTDNVLLKGPAAEIGLIGRLGLKNKDYDQTAVVTGSVGNSLPIAGALAGGPVVGAAVLLFTQVFKQPLRGLARGYYHITGGWDNPIVERITSADAASATAEVPK